MKGFRIEIDPPISPASEAYRSISPTGDIWGKLSTIPLEYNVIYHVNGRRFSYYPAGIATILNDLLLEWQLAQAREPHEMSLSGYTVLLAEFEDEDVVVYDPTTRAGDAVEEKLGRFDANDFEIEVKRSLDAVWHHVSDLLAR